MSFSNAFEDAILKLILNGTAIANIADNAASAPATSLYLSLHTADPGEAGSQSSSEASYSGYARIAIARTSSGWAVSGGVATLQNNVDFAECGSGASGTITHAGLGVASSGAGVLIGSGALPDPIGLANHVIPRVKSGSTITLD